MRAGVVGLGLIGGSLLWALRRLDYAVVGCDVDPEARALASDAGFDVVSSPRELDGAEVVFLATPLPALPGVLAQLSGRTGLLTDVTSVKAPVADLVRRHCPRARFVGGHPMAGKETSGFAAAQSELFDDRAWVLCLDDDTGLSDWTRTARLVCALGARVCPAPSAQHDAAVARVSHVPHLLAAAVTRLAADPLSRTLAAGSFADSTRVAATRAALTAAMCAGNADSVRAALHTLRADLDAAEALLDPDAPEAIHDWLATAQHHRLAWPPTAGSPQQAPITRAALLELGRDGGWVCAVSPDGDAVTTVRPGPQVT